MNTKKPQIYAESALHGDGYDWNQYELSILGDISVFVPVKIFDNGLHTKPLVYKTPASGFLIYSPGALLRNDKGGVPVDWEEVVKKKRIHLEGLSRLYERRFLAPFVYMDKIAESLGKQTLITIPGMGCGQFAGPFRGNMASYLQEAIYRFLTKHIRLFQNIKVVYFDPFDECENKRTQIEHLTFLTKPLRKGNTNKGQLSKVTDFQDTNDSFSSLLLCSIVAWDHVSWPGNDFYIGSRATDDGVKAAATNSMQVITGVAGSYKYSNNKYLPPEKYKFWKDVIYKNQLEIKVKDNVFVYPFQ
ncbi:MAG: hypothetical protein AAF518_25665 [Spirochaetota bacterium]